MGLKNSRLIAILPLIIALFFATGCKSKKTPLVDTKTIEAKNEVTVVEDALNSQLIYRTITTKGNVEFISGDNNGKKVGAVFKIKKDSVIQVSIRVMGFEAIRATFTPDSVFLIDRMKKKCVAENLSKALISRKIEFNFYNLQALLTNQLFLPGKKELLSTDYKKFDISNTTNVYMLKTADKNKLTYNFAIDGSDRIISTLISNFEQELTLQWTYKDFIQDGTYTYPRLISASADVDEHKFNLVISYSKLTIDTNFSIDFSVPNKYQKVSFKEFVSSYINIK